MWKNLFIIYVLLLQVCACNNDIEKKKALMSYLNDYSDVVGHRINTRDSLSLYYTPNGVAGHKGAYKIVSFINTSCGTCIRKMDEWNKFLSEEKMDVKEIIFVAQGKPDTYFREFIDSTKPAFYIYLDTSGYYLLNRHLDRYVQGTFLLDENDKVVMIGDPVSNETIYSFYNTIIHDKVMSE
ncbi:redoxin family protein [[Flexibacter] sp. ATCC 35208]|uniref:TlpA family protein disulfide reductase n=1 Tax=[Flexibacter] sp. ATCC 35208 TaxID=1936242 RepID=UPI0009C5720C|nr:redoxin family protein [[Flexibacter] sp. ATCC 35208]OMP79664.1 hypothetical protein BW716_08820 [[Flexibacter] sp. ATCC 35208]